MRDSLWPEFKIVDENSPKVILEEQARFLSRATSQVLYGEVTYSAISNIPPVFVDLPHSNIPKSYTALGYGNVSYSLYIVAPRLSNYKFELVTVTYYPLDYYPLIVSDAFAATPMTLPDENAYISYLFSLFNNEKVGEVISKLVAQSRKGKRFL